VTKANLNDKPEWEIFYKASNVYNVSFLNETQQIYEYTKKISKDNNVYHNLLKIFFTNGPLYEQYGNVKKMPTYLSCRFNLDIFHDYFKCIGYVTWDSEEYAYALLNFVSGSWYQRLPN
jgi:hypothetical protein